MSKSMSSRKAVTEELFDELEKQSPNYLEVKRLVTGNPKPDFTQIRYYSTPLMMSLFRKSLGLTKLLLENGADKTIGMPIKDNSDHNALFNAGVWKQHPIGIRYYRLFMDFGAQKYINVYCGSQTPFQAACYTTEPYRWGRKDTVRDCMHTVIKFLLKHGADANLREKCNNRNALIIALRCSLHLETLRLILKHTTKESLQEFTKKDTFDNDYMNSLMVACDNRVDPRIIEEIIKKLGDDVQLDKTDLRGNNVLMHYCSSHDDPVVFRLLLNKGALRYEDQKNAQGETFIDICKKKGRLDFIHMTNEWRRIEARNAVRNTLLVHKALTRMNPKMSDMVFDVLPIIASKTALMTPEQTQLLDRDLYAKYSAFNKKRLESGRSSQKSRSSKSTSSQK